MNPVPTLVVVLLATALVVGTVAAEVPAARLTVSAVEVAPTTPTVGETVVVTVTVSNSVASPSPVRVRQVELRGGGESLVQATEVGSLSAGDAVTVPLRVAFDEAGSRTLTLEVVGTDADNDQVRLTRPVPITVAAAAPLVDVSLPGPPPAVDSSTAVAVQLANPTADPVRNVIVTVVDDGAFAVDPPRRTLPVLAAESVETVAFEVVPTEVGDATVAVEVSYLTAVGVPGTVRAAQPVTVAPFVDDVGLAARPVTVEPDESGGLEGNVGDLLGGLGGGTLADDATGTDPTSRVDLVVTNFGTVIVEDVVVTPVALASDASTDGDTDRPLPRVALEGSLAPGESASIEVDLAPVRSDATVRFDVRYAAGVRTGVATLTYDWRPLVGEIRLTDVAAVADPDGREGIVRVTGNVANAGRGEVTGVIVAARPAPGVTPAQPGRDFFVGTVGPSDFAPFEVTVAVDPAAAAAGSTTGSGSDSGSVAGSGAAGDPIDLPVRVTYRDGGVPETVDATVEYRPVVDERASVPPTILAVGLGLLALGALAVVVRRRRWGRRDLPDPGPDTAGDDDAAAGSPGEPTSTATPRGDPRPNSGGSGTLPGSESGGTAVDRDWPAADGSGPDREDGR